MNNYREILDFYKGKRVFVTGHTGFKGTWLCRVLKNAGAIVTGYSLNPPTNPSLFEMAGLIENYGENTHYESVVNENSNAKQESKENDQLTSVIGDVRDLKTLKKAFEKAQPEIVLHLAAQPIVLKSYEEPHMTYETNVMGTVNILECVRMSSCVKSFLNVTTDKVYFNDDEGGAFTEDMPLDGYDPYSNSKSCSELVTHSYRSSFLKDKNISVSTARAGNVIGGGDFAENRIVPDCVRAAIAGEEIQVRNPYSVRPFQHVLEPIFAYLMIAKAQYEDMTIAGAYNVGPDESDCISAGQIADIFCESWGEGAAWKNISKEGPHEAGFLRLECALLKKTFGWSPVWDIKRALQMTVDFSKRFNKGENVTQIMDEQIEAYISDADHK